jgi:hypothetical protein
MCVMEMVLAHGVLHRRSVRPGAVVVAVESEDRAESTVRGPAQQVSTMKRAVVPATITVHVGLETVHAAVDHGLHRALERNLISRPPARG